MVKVTILSALLHHTAQAGRSLTAQERGLATSMITRSNNAATSVLWKRIGRSGLKLFALAAGMHSTRFGPGGLWGLTQITAEDQLKLLNILSTRNTVLDEAARVYATTLMTHVVPEQRWGVTAGFDGPSPAAVKNGWLPRAYHQWRVHSIGTFGTGDSSYSLVILSDGHTTFSQGQHTIEALARVIHKGLKAHVHHPFRELVSAADVPTVAIGADPHFVRDSWTSTSLREICSKAPRVTPAALGVVQRRTTHPVRTIRREERLQLSQQ
ncbi:serine hydrolase [Streptomyces sp. NPDC055709]